MSDITGQIAEEATALIESGEITAQNISRVSTLAQNPEALAQAIVNIENDIANMKQLFDDIKSTVSPEVQEKVSHLVSWAESALGFRHQG